MLRLVSRSPSPAPHPHPQPRPSDEALARRVAAGVERAFADLYRRLAPRLGAYARAIVRDEHEAHDAVQTAMLRALCALRERAPYGAVEPWLFRVVRNAAIDVVRRRRDHAPLSVAADRAADAGADAADVAVARETWEALLADVRGLPPKQRQALVERELAGRGYEELAARMGVSPLAARQAAFAARAKLRRGRALRAAA